MTVRFQMTHHFPEPMPSEVELDRFVSRHEAREVPFPLSMERRPHAFLFSSLYRLHQLE